MRINHDNYESILIDYFDGNLSDVERAEVDLFLQQNPEIAEQIRGLADMVLPSNDEIVYDKKEELLTATLPNQEFEEWENTQPKLSKEHISYPHKQKLFKLGRFRTQQWTWYAAAACLAIVVLVVQPWEMFENEKADSISIAETPIIVLPIEDEPPVLIAEVVETKYEVRGVRYEVASPIVEYIADNLPHTPHPETSHRERSEPISYPAPLFAIAMLQPITILPTIETTSHLAPDSEQILHFVQDDNRFIQNDNRLERLELAVNNLIITPAKSVIHNVTRRFFERRTEVEMFLEEREFPQFFARRQQYFVDHP